MNSLNQKEYKAFAQEYISVRDELSLYLKEYYEQKNSGYEIPELLLSKLETYRIKRMKMEVRADWQFNKSEIQLYEDGRGFQEEEMRTKCYGS